MDMMKLLSQGNDEQLDLLFLRNTFFVHIVITVEKILASKISTCNLSIL